MLSYLQISEIYNHYLMFDYWQSLLYTNTKELIYIIYLNIILIKIWMVKPHAIKKLKRHKTLGTLKHRLEH